MCITRIQDKGEDKLGVETNRKIQNKLMRGLLDMVVMQFLRAQPMHGYQIISSLRKQYGMYFGPSTVYPLLSMMEENGTIKSHWDLENERPRKVYTITSQGTELLNSTENSLTHIYRQLGTGANRTPFNDLTTPTNPASDKKLYSNVNALL